MSFLVAFQNFVELCNAISQINLHYDLIMFMCCHYLTATITDIFFPYLWPSTVSLSAKYKSREVH